jgi:hypothetical protein
MASSAGRTRATTRGFGADWKGRDSPGGTGCSPGAPTRTANRSATSPAFGRATQHQGSRRLGCLGRRAPGVAHELQELARRAEAAATRCLSPPVGPRTGVTSSAPTCCAPCSRQQRSNFDRAPGALWPMIGRAPQPCVANSQRASPGLGLAMLPAEYGTIAGDDRSLESAGSPGRRYHSPEIPAGERSLCRCCA